MSIPKSIHFQFLKTEWSKVYEAAAKAESLAYPDPRTACFGYRFKPGQWVGREF